MPNNSFHPCVSVPLSSKASENSGRGGTVRGKLNPAPAFGFNTASRRDSPSTPGRMENIRILIEQAKAATAEGRFSEAIRKYETALVTMPEGYKPRVRNKIARLEARLDVSNEQKIGMGSPSTRLSRGLHGDLGGSGDVPGPLDLLHVAVKDVTSSERVACSSAASATLSSRRPSSIPWEPYPMTGGAREERHESERGDDQEYEDQDRENVWDGKVNLVSDDDDTAQSKNCSQQDQRPLSNKALSDTLEKQIIDKMNKASYEELVNLHEIGFRRAQMILKTRAVTPFEVLSDLSRIGMFPKQIEKMGKHNMLECLDVGPRSADQPREGGPSDSIDLQEQS